MQGMEELHLHSENKVLKKYDKAALLEEIKLPALTFRAFNKNFRQALKTALIL
jgi:hypothetical protein